ncbi:MAG: amidohydrolase family protein [Pirellulaceae bacterium]
MTADVAKLATDYRQRRDALELFDVSCWLGRPLEPAFTTVAGADTLRAALRHYGIRRAVVSHTLSVGCGADEGNRAAIEAIQTDDTLVAAATLVPEMAQGGSWSALLRSLLAQRVRVVRLFPNAHNFLLADECLGSMLEALEQLRLPLVIWQTQTTWSAIARVCEQHPGLRLVVEGAGRKLFYDNRIYYALLERYPNLLLETHNLVNYLGLDDLVRRFGSERFLFGSHFPHLDPNSAAMLLCDGDMEQSDRRNIAHGNLDRLLAEIDLV